MAAKKRGKAEVSEFSDESEENSPSEDSDIKNLVHYQGKAREALREVINKQFGVGTAFGASNTDYPTLQRISSGSFTLDYALGGGWPRGRMIVAWGSRSAGKTTTCLRAIADAQLRDAVTNKYLWQLSPEEKKLSAPMVCAWIDIEGTFDFAWAEQIGVDLGRLEYILPSTHEEAVDIVQACVKSKVYHVIVVDSLAAPSHEKERDAGAEEKDVGAAARLNNKMFRKLQMELNEINRTDRSLTPTIFFVNQMRQTINQMGGGFGPNRIKPGGNGQDFFSSVEVFFWANTTEYFDEAKMVPKSTVFGYKVEKNKVSPPKIQGEYKQALTDHPKGQWREGEVIEFQEVMDFAKKLGFYEEIEEKSKKRWVIMGEEFSKKGDLFEKYVLDKHKFTDLKLLMLKKIFPKTFREPTAS